MRPRNKNRSPLPGEPSATHSVCIWVPPERDCESGPVVMAGLSYLTLQSTLESRKDFGVKTLESSVARLWSQVSTQTHDGCATQTHDGCATQTHDLVLDFGVRHRLMTANQLQHSAEMREGGRSR